ncbi:MAG TPA: hypothetical protein H9873_04800 [Candidatus Dorea gallistercoris]|uniref:Uncharacterized protein n=1 Tax=Candidatus Dorea gallistercoris TaxID=2838542 RepID=A0A9D1UDT7_9FIRM|nr:hypothetical protein [Candidatus Dorea gallistercoris]
MSKSRVFFRVIVGGYLAYTGFSLVGNAMRERPDNYILYTVIGVLFLVVGVAWCAGALLKIARHEYDDGMGEEPAIEEEPAEEEPEREENAPEKEEAGDDRVESEKIHSGKEV